MSSESLRSENTSLSSRRDSMIFPSTPRMVYFSVRTRDNVDILTVKDRVEKILGLKLTPYVGRRYEPPVFETTVLGIWIILGEVKSMQADAPRRYQLQGRQRPDDDADFNAEIQDIDDYVLHVLGQAEPGRWYRPSEQEVGIDVGLEEGRIQDLPH